MKIFKKSKQKSSCCNVSFEPVKDEQKQSLKDIAPENRTESKERTQTKK